MKKVYFLNIILKGLIVLTLILPYPAAKEGGSRKVARKPLMGFTLPALFCSFAILMSARLVGFSVQCID